MHELEQMKRAQVQQVEEMTMQKLRENHETIQQLTSQLQHWQEHMSSMNSSGELQDIESNKWKIVSRFQSTRDDSDFSCFAQPRQKIAA